MEGASNVKMTPEERKRFEDLFSKLDVNKDGKVEVNELSAALKKMKGLSDKAVTGHAQVLLLASQKRVNTYDV